MTSSLLQLIGLVLLGIVEGGHDDATAELAARERLQGLLAVLDALELDEDLAAALLRLRLSQGARDLEAAHLAVLGALQLDVRANVLVLLVVQQLLGQHHVEQAEHLGGCAAVKEGGVQSRHLEDRQLLASHGVLATGNRALDHQLALPQLHAIQSGDGLVRDRGVQVLEEGEALAQIGDGVLDQVEAPQLAEGQQQLLDLRLVQARGQPPNVDLVRSVRNGAGDDAIRQGSGHDRRIAGGSRGEGLDLLAAADGGHRVVVVGPSDLQILSAEVDAIEVDGLGGLVHGPELEEGKVLLQIGLAREHCIAVRLGGVQSQGLDLLVEERHHVLLCDAEWNVAHIQATRLPGDHRDGRRLPRGQGLWHNPGSYLSARLHRLVLDGAEVGVALRRNVPGRTRPPRTAFRTRPGNVDRIGARGTVARRRCLTPGTIPIRATATH